MTTAKEAAAKFRLLGKTLEGLPDLLAETALDLIREGFATSTDPYGEPWEETQRGGKILVDTATMLNSWHVEGTTERSFAVASGVEYAQFHQDGTVKMVARKMVPDGDRPLPKAWEDAFAADIQATIEGALKT